MKPYNIEEIKTNFPKDAFELIYMDYSKTKEEIRNQLGVSSSKLDFIANLYNLKRDNRLMLERRKDSFKDTLNRVSKEDLKVLFCDEMLSIPKIGKKLGVCEEVVNKLVKHYKLERSRKDLMKLTINKSKNYGKDFQESITRISKEDLIKYYIDEDHEYEETAEYFHIKCSMLDKIKLYYGVKKDFSKTASKNINKKYIEYGSKENYINHLKIKSRETLIHKYGSLDNIPDFLHKKNSKPNLKFKKLLEDLNISFTQEFPLSSREYDFKVGDSLIEINPTYTHNSTWSHFNEHGLDPKYHYNKSKLALANGYRCIHIFDWDNSEKISKSLQNKEIVYAKNGEIKEVPKIDADEFLNIYHFQNSCRGQKIILGLYFKDELIQLMSFGTPRYNKNYEWELLRLCTKNNYLVVGGAERLFKHFINIYGPKSIISYCDNSKFKGDIYLKLGMYLLNSGKPTKHWYNEKLNIHITQNLLSQRGFDQLLGDKFGNYGKGTNNEDLMLAHGFVEVYDCGQSSYGWINYN